MALGPGSAFGPGSILDQLEDDETRREIEEYVTGQPSTTPATPEEETRDLRDELEGVDVPTQVGDQLLRGDEVIADFGQILEDVQTLQDVPSFQEWATAQGYTIADLDQAQLDYQNYLATIEGRDIQADMAVADDYAAQRLGYADLADYLAQTQGLRDTLEAGTGQGYTDAERAIIQRGIARESARMEQMAQGLVDRILSQTGGSSSRAMSAADAALSQIADYNLKSQMELIQDEAQLKLAQFQSSVQAQASLSSQMGEASESFMNRLENQYMSVLSGYAQNVENVISQNRELANLYTTEINAAMESMYNSIMIQMGVEEAAIENGWREANMEMEKILGRSGMTQQEWDMIVDQYGIDQAAQILLEESQWSFTDFLTELLLPAGEIAAGFLF